MHLDGEHVGQIVRRTAQGFMLDTGIEIQVAEVCAITAAPLQPPKRDPRDRRLRPSTIAVASSVVSVWRSRTNSAISHLLA